MDAAAPLLFFSAEWTEGTFLRGMRVGIQPASRDGTRSVVPLPLY